MTAVLTAISLMPNDARYVLVGLVANSEKDENRLPNLPTAVKKLRRGRQGDES
jgi:hypothetical protein